MKAVVEEGIRAEWLGILKTSAEGNTNCDNGFSSASFEGQIGNGIGKTVQEEEFPSMNAPNLVTQLQQTPMT